MGCVGFKSTPQEIQVSIQMKFVKEPLCHFFIIGAALFGLSLAFSPDTAESEKRIVVEDGQINNLTERYKKMWQRPPTRKELEDLVNEHVLEEIYYRKAMALGLHKQDAIIRKRLRQKMEFYSEAAASFQAPDDKELERFLQEHADRYRTPNRYSFQQIYINGDRPAREYQKRVHEIQQALEKDVTPEGDPSLLPKHFRKASTHDVTRRFGKGFSNILDSLDPNVWSKPLASGMGLHFIKLTDRTQGVLPPLSAIRTRVESDWRYEQNQAFRGKLNRDFMAEYEVEIQWPGGQDGQAEL